MKRAAPPVDPAQAAAADLMAWLETDGERGLEPLEAARRLEADGPNALRKAPRQPAWRRLLAQLREPLAGLLLLAIIVALVAWVLEGRVGWPVDAAVIGVVVVLNAGLSAFHEARAADAVASLARMTAVSSSVLRAGQLLRIPSDELVRGDLLILSEGDAVGADARLLHCAGLRIQEASLTGESEAVEKDCKPVAATAALADQINRVWKGTTVTQGSGRALVTATGMDTQIGAIAHLLLTATDHPTPLQKEVAGIGRVLGIAVVVIAVAIVTTLLLLSEVHTAAVVIPVLLLGVSLAVAAVPEGLPSILAVVLAMGVQRMARRNAVVKQLSSVETLGSASVICTDKTGTLTRSEMTIERLVTASGETRVTGVGYDPDGRLAWQGAALAAGPAREECTVLLSGGSLAGNAHLQQDAGGVWRIQGDPTEAAFLVAEHKLGVTERRKRRFERVAELPFSAERKMMSTVELDHEHGDARVLITKGAPDVLLARCDRQRAGMAVVPLDDEERKKVLAHVDRLSGAALRTLGVAYRPLAAAEALSCGEHLEQGLIFVGIVGMMDPPRPEAGRAIAQAHRAGIRVIMITGDHPRTAARIAEDLGLAPQGATVLTGAELDGLDTAAFDAAVRRVSLYARVAPAHKLRIVAALQSAGSIVAMTGDGVNDAPALKAADIGIAMGVTGTEVTKDAARMILADDNFATIVDAVREGRALFDNIRKFLRYLLSSNTGEVLTVFLGVAGSGVLGLGAAANATAGGHDAMVLPLLATQILWVNLVTDAGPALAIGVDPQTEDVMAREPRDPAQRAIDAPMLWNVLWTGAAMALATLLTIDLHLPGGLIAGSHDLATARTAGFTVLVLAQLFNCFNSRSDTASAFHGIFRNRWLWASVALSALLQVAVVHVAPLNIAFSTVPLDLRQWAVCIAMSSSVLWMGEVRKVVLRRTRRRATRSPRSTLPARTTDATSPSGGP